MRKLALPVQVVDGAWHIFDLLDYTDRVDPNNTRTKDMRGYMQRLRGVLSGASQMDASDAARILSEYGKRGI